MSKLLLSTSSYMYRLLTSYFSPQLAMDLSQVEQLTSVVCEDVNTFFSRQSWLNNVKAFIDTYSSSNVSDFLLPKKFKVHNITSQIQHLFTV